MKVLTAGQHLWTRTIGSTVVGQFFDSILFYPLAFAGTDGWSTEAIVQVVISQFVLKVAWEVLLTPVTYAVIGALKRREGVDVFDDQTNFSPFAAERR